jgi:hypothetical protein
VSDIVKEGGVQRLFDGELIVQVVFGAYLYMLYVYIFLGLCYSWDYDVCVQPRRLVYS